ncbi:MAG: aminoacyl-tRNA hydrolase [bacterium]
MKVIVGLGNPGAEYARTPHNMGFMVVDTLAERLGCRLKDSSGFEARIGSARHAGEELILVQPQTFMNASGRAVGAVLNYRKVGAQDLWVVVDDADIPLGSLRIRKLGGTGGHRGLASISEVLGTPEYGRVRVGIGRGARQNLVGHVLGAFGRDEWAEACKAVDVAAEAVLAIVGQGADVAMNRFNIRPDKKAGENDVTAGGEKQ